MIPQPTGRGGSRIGAGRPPLPESERAVTISIAAHPRLVGKFKRHCKAVSLSQRKVFEQWVERLPTPPA